MGGATGRKYNIFFDKFRPSDVLLIGPLKFNVENASYILQIVFSNDLYQQHQFSTEQN